MDTLSFIASFPRLHCSPSITRPTPRRCRHHRFNCTQLRSAVIYPNENETNREVLETRLRSLGASSAAGLVYATFSEVSLPPTWEHLLEVLSSHGITGKTLSRIASRLGIYALLSLDPDTIPPILEHITKTLPLSEAQRNRIITQRPDLLSVKLSTLTASTDALLEYLNPHDLKHVALRWPGVLILSQKVITRVTTFFSSRPCLLTARNIRWLLRRAPWILIYDIDNDMAPVVYWLQDEILPHSTDPLAKYLLASPQLLGTTRTHLHSVMRFLREEIGMNIPTSVSVIRQFPPLLTCSVEEILRPAVSFLSKDVGLGNWQISKVIRAFPAVLTLDIEKEMRPNMNYFRGKGITNIARLVSRLPPILGYDLESEIIPKTEYVERVLGLSLFDILRFPAYFSYDLPNKIEPRTRFLQAIGVRIAEVGLNVALSLSDEAFCSRVGASRKSYYEFRKTGAYRQSRTMRALDNCADSKDGGQKDNAPKSVDLKSRGHADVVNPDEPFDIHRVGNAKRRKKRFRATLTRMPWAQMGERS